MRTNFHASIIGAGSNREFEFYCNVDSLDMNTDVYYVQQSMGKVFSCKWYDGICGSWGTVSLLDRFTERMLEMKKSKILPDTEDEEHIELGTGTIVVVYETSTGKLDIYSDLRDIKASSMVAVDGKTMRVERDHYVMGLIETRSLRRAADFDEPFPWLM